MCGCVVMVFTCERYVRTFVRTGAAVHSHRSGKDVCVYVFADQRYMTAGTAFHYAHYPRSDGLIEKRGSACEIGAIYAVGCVLF